MLPERSPGPPSWLLPSTLALFAAVLRVLRASRSAVMMNDGPEFIRLAQEIATGEWHTVLTHGFHPLYPLAVRVLEPLFGDWERAGIAVSALSGAAAVVALFWLVADTFDRRSAAIAAFLLAVHPIALEHTDVQSDPLYLALFVASAAALWRAVSRPGTAWAFGSGLLAGTAYLTRPEGLGTLVVGIGLAGVAVLRARWSLAAAARFALALALGVALTGGPLIAFLSAQTGSLTLTEKKSLTGVLSGGAVEGRRSRPPDPLLAERPDLTPPERGASPFRDATVPKGWHKYSEAVSRLFSVTPKALRVEFLVLLLIGALSLRGPPTPRGQFYLAYTLLYAIVLLGLSASSGYVSRRHVLPPGVLLFGYAAAGVEVVAGAIERALRGRVSARTATAILLVVLAIAGSGKALRGDRGGAVAARRAAEWLRAQGTLREGEAVAAVKQRVAWYAGAPYVDLRRVPHRELLLPYLQREHVRFAIVNDRERGVLESLLEKTPDAVHVVHTERDADETAFVYELR